MLVGGALSSVLRTVNMGTGADVKSNLQVLRKYQPTGPLFVTEFWCVRRQASQCVRVCVCVCVCG
jgi:hypothetical protein